MAEAPIAQEHDPVRAPSIRLDGRADEVVPVPAEFPCEPAVLIRQPGAELPPQAVASGPQIEVLQDQPGARRVGSGADRLRDADRACVRQLDQAVELVPHIYQAMQQTPASPVSTDPYTELAHALRPKDSK